MQNWKVVVEVVGGNHLRMRASRPRLIRRRVLIGRNPCHPMYHATVPACTLNVPCTVRTIEFYTIIVM